VLGLNSGPKDFESCALAFEIFHYLRNLIATLKLSMIGPLIYVVRRLRTMSSIASQHLHPWINIPIIGNWVLGPFSFLHRILRWNIQECYFLKLCTVNFQWNFWYIVLLIKLNFLSTMTVFPTEWVLKKHYYPIHEVTTATGVPAVLYGVSDWFFFSTRVLSHSI